MRLAAVDIRSISDAGSRRARPGMARHTRRHRRAVADGDILSVHLHLNEHTRGIIDDRRLRLLKPSAFLINVARGPLVDERSAGGRARRRAAWLAPGLDVFAHEPLELDSPLLRLPNVVATPHTAGHSGGTWRRRASSARTTSIAWRPASNRSVASPDAHRRRLAWGPSARPTWRRCSNSASTRSWAPTRRALLASAPGRTRSRCLADYRDLLETAGLDGVVIATPPRTHRDIALAALAAGARRAVRKAARTDAGRLRSHRRRRRERRGPFQVGFCHRFQPQVQALLGLIRSGSIGDRSWSTSAFVMD